MIETVIKGTHSIEEYKQAKATLEELTQQAYKKHRMHISADGQWTHGEPVKARYNEVTGRLQVTYSDSLTFEYNRNLDPVEVIK